MDQCIVVVKAAIDATGVIQVVQIACSNEGRVKVRIRSFSMSAGPKPNFGASLAIWQMDNLLASDTMVIACSDLGVGAGIFDIIFAPRAERSGWCKQVEEGRDRATDVPIYLTAERSDGRPSRFGIGKCICRLPHLL